MEKRKGVRDLMEKNRYRPKHLRESLISKGVPGSWEGKSGLQNIYNLIDGRIMPKDAYVFVVLSELLQEPLKEILIRYSSKKVEANVFDGVEVKW